jgi:NAD(P)H-flavin reductase
MVTAVLSTRRDVGGGVLLIGLRPPPEIATRYKAPGQYVEVLTDSGAGFFVLAGELDASEWELLVRNSGGAADALANGPLGSTVEVSAPLGQGFPIELARGRRLGIAVAGSAVGAARPIMHARMASGEASSTEVFVGARSARDVPLSGEIETWIRAGARVVLCLSRSELDHDRTVLAGAERVAGYVQRAVAKLIDSPELPNAVVFAAGPEAMLAELRETPRRPSVEVVTNV